MVPISAHVVQATADIAHVGTMAGGLTERAEALLDPVRRLTRCDAAFVHVFDPDRSLQVPLVHQGYDERIQQYLSTPAFSADVAEAGGTGRRPFRVVDLPTPVLEIPFWAEYAMPAGFREGIGVPLRARDGRYVGFLGVTSVDREPCAPAVRDRLGALAPLMAHAVDPLRALSVRASLVGDATAGAVLTRAGRVTALPGLPDHRLLTPGSPVLAAAAAQLADGSEHAVFLAPQQEPGPGLVRVTVLVCPQQPPGHLRALVLLSPPPDLYGLTRRELELCGLLVQGRSNAAIATALAVKQRTVAAHLEHIFAKLGASSRSMAAVLALRRGLYLPPQVAGGPPQ